MTPQTTGVQVNPSGETIRIGPLTLRFLINAAAGGRPDRVKMGEIMRRHGLTPAP